MSKGLSHIVLTASTKELFERTLEFYKAFGFVNVTSPGQKDEKLEEKETWLRLSADAHALTSDIIIRVSLKPNAVTRPKLDDDVDWSLSESAISLTISDIAVNIYIITFFVRGKLIRYFPIV